MMTGMPLAEFMAVNGIGPWHFIYGLHDPRGLILRYIGKSDDPIRRLASQLNEHAATYRCHWIGELRSLGLTPIQTILDAAAIGTDWQTIERAYIAAARAAGYPLVNGTDGGDGVSGLREEARARIRATWLGRKHTPETLAKLSASSKGRVHTAEWRAMMHERMAGREFSETHRQRIREGVQKLTTDQVHGIRAALATGEKQGDIAARFGVHQGSISNIARGRTYRDVPREG